MKIINKKISLKELEKLAAGKFGMLVKAVVDIEHKIMAVDGELHSDEEGFLISQGSKQSNLWGIILYPELNGEEFVEFDSMINIRPSAGNNSRSVEDPKVRKIIIDIVNDLVEK
ncbi:MAG: hypothetical protein UX91_C0005G0059 [Candidatus Amesbacteria bacterium GW2011_GWB1_47_19]|nr:MAG: hypothetical protein UW51_C0007G0059 [Candidatus Amesbacteria bacterium GW2011_GWA1_44_24]KKU31141.1 MAG: hypothetical protein UX46_C0007G0059 [Candidatus Amesbacteria bacterium GW2011_GWC1_46_24]KKU67262.1 MAG: hypothetical protein UX91_C0005G0059 [Candidatus Amesbacteria bacterium GW2011_GWB1_47_19]OGD05822.1 MAG: hypothetical protein A2379_01780 [Candidatus Amesbacteria bacterium RIFOXYB1_FULL_47_13]HBC72684.1 hypothetical protein [Candidatus Amesbacteria bacterium]